MSEDTQQPPSNAPKGVRYSLKEIMEEVAIDRRDSVFGRELVDETEIDKMFGKQVRKKKKK
jgi:hypothetical protein